MEDVNLDYAREHLEELLVEAAKGGEVRITAPAIGTVRLLVVVDAPVASSRGKRRTFGRLAGKIAVPPGMLDPMTEAELKDWYGEAE